MERVVHLLQEQNKLIEQHNDLMKALCNAIESCASQIDDVDTTLTELTMQINLNEE